MCANLTRLWRDKAFWACVLGALLLSILNMLNGCRQAVQDMGDFEYMLEHYYYQPFHFLILILPVFTSLFIGTEYSDGTLRNKLIVGHRRVYVYLAQLATCTIASLLILAALYLGGLVGIPVLGAWKMGAGMLCTYACIAIGMTVAFSAIFTLTGMLTSNRAISVVVSMLVALGILVVGSTLYEALQEAETITGVIITAENGVQLGDSQPNPNYVTGLKRSVYEFFIDFVPSGQSIQLADLSVAHPVRMLLSSLYILLGTTLYGTFIFQRKDVK